MFSKSVLKIVLEQNAGQRKVKLGRLSGQCLLFWAAGARAQACLIIGAVVPGLLLTAPSREKQQRGSISQMGKPRFREAAAMPLITGHTSPNWQPPSSVAPPGGSGLVPGTLPEGPPSSLHASALWAPAGRTVEPHGKDGCCPETRSPVCWEGEKHSRHRATWSSEETF